MVYPKNDSIRQHFILSNDPPSAPPSSHAFVMIPDQRNQDNGSPPTVPTNATITKTVTTTKLSKAKNDNNHNRKIIPRSPSLSESSTASSSSSSSYSSLSSYEYNHNACYRYRKCYDFVAIDCEMVGIGMDGLDSMLARVTIVDWDHNVIYDQYVKPQSPVMDYRTHVSGVTKEDLESTKAVDFNDCRRTVKKLMRHKIVVGHGLINDFHALRLNHPWYMIRDTAYYQPFMKMKSSSTSQQQSLSYFCPRKLKELSAELLHQPIQHRCHSSIEDAIAALQLYKLVQRKFEQHIKFQFMKMSLLYNEPYHHQQQQQQQLYQQQKRQQQLKYHPQQQQQEQQSQQQQQQQRQHNKSKWPVDKCHNKDNRRHPMKQPAFLSSVQCSISTEQCQ